MVKDLLAAFIVSVTIVGWFLLVAILESRAYERGWYVHGFWWGLLSFIGGATLMASGLVILVAL